MQTCVHIPLLAPAVVSEIHPYPKVKFLDQFCFDFLLLRPKSLFFYSGYTILPDHQAAHKGSDSSVSSLTLFYPLIFAIAVVVIMNIRMGLKW